MSQQNELIPAPKRKIKTSQYGDILATKTESLVETAINAGGVLVQDSELIPAPEIFEPISETQKTAIELHKRGLNVFPIPLGHKKPYILKPFFSGRLYRSIKSSGKKIFVPKFSGLFEKQNLAVMMGRTSENLFAIDCDTQADFRGIGAELDRRGIYAWRFKSKRGGSYLLRLAEGEAKNITLPKWEHVEIWGNKHFVILPPSIHPSGLSYTWGDDNIFTDFSPLSLAPDQKPPLISIQALDWLGVQLNTTGNEYKAPELHGLPKWTLSLSQKNRDILANAIKGDYQVGERNIALTPPVYDIAYMIQEGEISYTEGLELLTLAAEGVEYSGVTSMLKSALKKQGLTSAKKSGPGASIQSPSDTEQLYSFAASHDWNQYGRTQHTDRAIFLACIERDKLDAGRGSFRAASREIAEATNKTRKTISKGLKRLISYELLAFSHIDKTSLANRYKFGGVVTNYPTSTIHCSCSGVVNTHQKTIKQPETEAEKDVFGRLGAISWGVYIYLLENYAHSYGEIAKATGLKRESIRRTLSRGKNTGNLIKYKLVEFNPAEHSYHANKKTDEELERIAVHLTYRGKAVLGRTAKRKRDHETERDIRRNLLLAQAMLRNTKNALNQ